MTEPSLVYYGNSLMSVSQVVKLLLRLPYMTYGGWAGYAALALTVILLRRQVRADRTILPVVAIGAATLVVSLLVIYPVGNPVANSWDSFGTWYRTPCVINTLLLVAFAYAVANLRQAPAKIALMTMLLIAVLHGSHRTAEQWDRMKAEQVAEAEFILENPDKMLVSQVRAVWFLRGVAALFPGAEGRRLRVPVGSAAKRGLHRSPAFLPSVLDLRGRRDPPGHLCAGQRLLAEKP